MSGIGNTIMIRSLEISKGGHALVINIAVFSGTLPPELS